MCFMGIRAFATTFGRTCRAGFLAAVAVLACASAHGFERQPICAQQETSRGWSRVFHVEALVVRGMELNEAKKGMRYSPASLYVVLMWNENRNTAVELAAPVFPDIGQEGRDERGFRWRVWRGVSCS